MKELLKHEEQTVWLSCRCHQPDHLHKYTLTRWEYEDRLERELGGVVFINPTRCWYKRVYLAVRYIFNGALPAGSQFDDVIFRRDDAKKLYCLLDEYLREDDIVWRQPAVKESKDEGS